MDDSICLDCLYGSQPYGYYPIICVHEKNYDEQMWYDKHKCKYFKQCPKIEEKKQVPFNVINCNI